VAEDILDQTLIRSRYLHVVPLDTGSFLAVQTLQQARAVLQPDVLDLLNSFSEPRQVGPWVKEYAASRGLAEDKILQCVKGLLDVKMLFAGTEEAEERTYKALLSQLFGRDPEAARVAAMRWASQQVPRFAAPAPRDLESFAALERRLDLVLVGLCEVQVGMDVLRSAGREVGLDLRLIPTFDSTIEMLKETPHDAVVVGPLSARLGVWNRGDGGVDLLPERYLNATRALLERLRDLTEAPIIVQNLAVPTAPPLGFAERGPGSLKEKARRINRELLELADQFADVFVLDVDAVLAYEGKRRLLDDRVVGSAHLGGLGWWMLLPPVELTSVHGIRPPLERLSELGVSDPFEFDRVINAELIALLSAIFGHRRRSLVLVDFDGVLWPGNLAETGSPFPGKLDYTTLSYHAFFLGVHEALKALRARGIELGGLGRGDEASTLKLWRYPARSPAERLVHATDFTSTRISDAGAAAQVGSLLEELETAPEGAVFVSASPENREEVQKAFPKILVLGENPFAIRGTLLTEPALQVANIREESEERRGMTKALFERERARRASGTPEEFLASLEVRCVVRRHETEDLDRLYDLVLRTNQFTTTGRRFSRRSLEAMARGDGPERVYTLRAEDRFTDYGLVGVAVTIGDTLELLLLACRVVGLGIEKAFLRAVLADLLPAHPEGVKGRLARLDENLPARSLFSENGFLEESPGLWTLASAEALPEPPSHVTVVVADVGPSGVPVSPEATERGEPS
jgi:FkbH-like protein